MLKYYQYILLVYISTYIGIPNSKPPLRVRGVAWANQAVIWAHAVKVYMYIALLARVSPKLKDGTEFLENVSLG